MLLTWLSKLVRRQKQPRPAAKKVAQFRPQVEGLEERAVPAAIRNVPGFRANILDRNDDNSTGAVPLGFTANFFGIQRQTCFVNNNGNITFDAPLAQFTPDAITASNSKQIIAPFFADVDTRNPQSEVLTYGTATINGQRAFGVDWFNVGYFGSHADKLNTFQLILIESCNGAPGDFDIEFNYQSIQWETGDASSGQNGFGGQSARVGYTNGTGQPGTFFELPGSAINGAFLDNGPQSLVGHRLNSNVNGRYRFFAHNGTVTQTETSPPSFYATGADIGGGPEVKVYSTVTNALVYDFFAYDQAFRGGVRVAVADVNGDGVPDIITAPGPGGGPHIKVFDGKTGSLMTSFFAYNPNFQGGVFLAAGNVVGGGKAAQIVTGPDVGGGSHIRVFNGVGVPLQNFFAFDPLFFSGARVAIADVNEDGIGDIVVGAGPGGGPHVKAFSGADGSLLESFFAFDPSYTGGVYVSGAPFGDAAGCALASSLVAVTGGTGAPPVVKVFDGTGTLVRSIQVEDTNQLFFGDVAQAFSGLRVAGADVNHDGVIDLLVSFGPSHTPLVKAYDFVSGRQIRSFFAYDQQFTGGVFLGGQ